MVYWGPQHVICEYCERQQVLTVDENRKIHHVAAGDRPPGGAGTSTASYAQKKATRHKLWHALRTLEQAGIDVSHVQVPPPPEEP